MYNITFTLLPPQTKRATFKQGDAIDSRHPITLRHCRRPREPHMYKQTAKELKKTILQYVYIGISPIESYARWHQIEWKRCVSDVCVLSGEKLSKLPAVASPKSQTLALTTCMYVLQELLFVRLKMSQSRYRELRLMC